MTRPNRHISKLAQSLKPGSPFTGPEAMERASGQVFKARLGANENGFGPSPRAIEAMARATEKNWMYADPDSFDLKKAISKHHGVPAENVIIGEGIDGLLGIALTATLDPGQAVVTSDGAYPTFNHHVACHVGRLVKVAYRGDQEDLLALAQVAKRERAKVVYVSNPDNPMGSWWTAHDIDGFEKHLAPDAVLFLDEAYCDTAPNGTAPRFDPQNPRLIRFRTFSKAYGLAGARIGYAIAHQGLIAAMDKVRNQYGINRVGQVGALAAIGDQAYLKAVVTEIASAREALAEIAIDNGLRPLLSGANFVAIDCGRDGDFAARVMEEVLKRDVFIRMPSVAPLNRCIRVTAGPREELDVFAEVLPKALKVAQD